MNAEILEKVQLWQEHLTDPELKEELDALVAAGDEDKLFDAFYRSLAFGTAGLRGVLGVGTNRMNIHVVAQATQGLADYLNAHYENPTVAIARDSRLHGEDFQKVAAGVLAANGIHVFVYPRIEPVPTLSFAVRYLKTSAGIVLTASHNPAPYNGYKVYNDNGGQIANEAADEISANIAKVDIFDDVRCMDFDEALEKGLIEWTPEEVLDAFIAAVKKVSVPGFKAADGYKVVYTPLNGTGIECVTRILKEIGVTDVSIVPEQAEPDGHFPTCTYPNPEFREALDLALKLAEEVKPNLVVATDPDADRMGAAIPHDGDYVLISGNEMGVLMMDWLCQQAAKNGENVAEKVAVTTIVSSVMPDALAEDWGFELRRVLTGFKYLGGHGGALQEVRLLPQRHGQRELPGRCRRRQDGGHHDRPARGAALRDRRLRRHGRHRLRHRPRDAARRRPAEGGPAGASRHQRHRVPPRGRQQGHLPPVRHRAQGQGLPLRQGRDPRGRRGRAREARRGEQGHPELVENLHRITREPPSGAALPLNRAFGTVPFSRFSALSGRFLFRGKPRKRNRPQLQVAS